MRVGIIGAGAVGGAVGAVLARTGHEVEVTARGAHLEAIRANGIRLSGAWGAYTARVEAHERLSKAAELVIVATKAQDAVGAIHENIAVVDGTPLLVIQNGLDGITNARMAAPHSDVIGGLAVFASSFLSPGVITVTTGGSIVIGVLGGDDLPARFVQRALGDALALTITDNFLGAQWSKLMINQVNALPAITGLSTQDVISHAGLRAIMTRAMREQVAIARALRVRFEPVQGLGPALAWFVGAAPLWLGQLLPLALRAKIGRVPNPGSTLQSVRRGQPTEIDFLNGSLVRAAEGVGMTAPVNERLVALVHEVEFSGEFLRPDEVVARF